MTTVKVACIVCGDTDAELAAVTLFIFNRTNRHYYELHCPECGTLITEHADGPVRRLLRENSCRTYYVRIPLEACEVHSGPTLTKDDVNDAILDLYVEGPELEMEQWEEQRARGDSNSQPSA